VADIVRKVVSEATFYSWKKKFGAMGTAEIRELRQLREENSKLKRLVADLSLTPMRRRFDLPFSQGLSDQRTLLDDPQHHLRPHFASGLPRGLDGHDIMIALWQQSRSLSESMMLPTIS